MSSGKLYVSNENDEIAPFRSFIDLEELKNVEPKDVPTTAHEFLASVIAERKVTAEARYNESLEELRKNQSMFYDQAPLPSVPDKLKPTREWQRIQVGDFSELRSYISRMRKQQESLKKISKPLNVEKDAGLNCWRNIVNKYEPSLSAVINLKAVKVDNGLENLTKLVKKVKPGDTIDYKTGRWIYAMLACLKPPLHSDSISIVRDLAKQCWELRSHIDPENEEAHQLAAPLSLIICIVGNYYRQLDLTDSNIV